jgi:hypothetical protein
MQMTLTNRVNCAMADMFFLSDLNTIKWQKRSRSIKLLILKKKYRTIHVNPKNEGHISS